MARRCTALLVGVLLGGSAPACAALTSFDGLTGGGSATTDASAPDAFVDAPSDEPSLDAPGPGVVFDSCAAAHAARPSAPSGIFDLDPDGAGPSVPVKGYCDMTNDDGGWLRIDESLLGAETSEGVTVVKSVSSTGGLVLRVYANIRGCGVTVEHARHLALLAPAFPWSRVRFRQVFGGHFSCWTIAGAVDPYFPLPHNLLAYSPTADVARDGVGMGGVDGGDVFDGTTQRCDSLPANFWDVPGPDRSVTFILRRAGVTPGAGLSTHADCGEVGEGTTSPGYWEYRDIYVK